MRRRKFALATLGRSWEFGGLVEVSTTVEVFVDELPAGLTTRGHSAESFSDLYARCRAPLVAYCGRLLAGRGDPEATAQEAFLHAWSAWDRYSPSRPFWPWLATIARRLCHDNWRHLERVSGREHALARLSSEPLPEPAELVEDAEERRLVMLAFRELRPEQQRIVGLRDVEGWAYEEIADFEGVTVESVRGSLRRARSALRRAYSKVANGVPAVLGLGWLGGIRRRLSLAAERVERTGLTTGGIERLGDAAVGVVALAITLSSAAPARAMTADSERPTAVAPAAAGAPAETAARNAPNDRTAAAAGTRAPLTAPGLHPTPTTSAPTVEAGAAPVPTAPLAPGVVPPAPELPSDGGAAPEDATFHQLAVPSGSSGTVFAVGSVSTGCRYPPCAAIFRSTDAGATWTRLPATGFTGGTLLVPPAYPADRRLFAVGPAGLQVSEDDGRTFASVTPLGGPAAMSPAFSAGDPVIWLGGAPGWRYDDRGGTVSPLTLVAGSNGGERTFAFSPAWPAETGVLVGTTAPDPAGGPQTAAIVRCDGADCRPALTLPGAVGTPSVLWTPQVALAWRDDALFRSTDGGLTWTRSSSATPFGAVQSVVDDGRGGLYLAGVTLPAVPGSGGLFRSTDGGATWQRIGGPATGSRVLAVAALSDGRVLVSRSTEAGSGLLCSHDGGVGWSTRCGG